MFCKNCGAEVKEGSKFCLRCGNPVGGVPKMQPTVPDVKKTPDYVPPAPKSKSLKPLIIVLVLLVIVGMCTALGFLFYPTIKDKIAGGSYEGTFKKAEAAYASGDYEAAVGHYIKLIEQKPDDVPAIIGLARSYNKLGRQDDAIDALVEGYSATGYDSDDANSSGDSEVLKLLEEYLSADNRTLEDVKIYVLDKDKDSGNDTPASEADSTGTDPSGDDSQQKVPATEKQDINIEIRQVDTTDFPNVKIYVSITDNAGNVIENISKSDFDITEIDKDGNVSNATIDDVHKVLGADKINVNLVLDASGSMDDGGKMTQAKNAANSLIDYMSLDTGDRVEVISFDDYVYLEQDFTSREELLATAIDGINPGGMTALYDAIYAGVYQTFYENGAKCVIAFTDGAENASSHSFNEVVDIAKNTSIPVFIIGIGDDQYDSGVLRNLASECSGRYYSANDSDLQSILEDIYIGIYKEEQDYYVFDYTASNKNDVGEFRDLVIDTSETSEYRGHYTKSYIPEPETAPDFSDLYANKDYIIDFSSSREVTSSDLAGMSLAELRIARNEIFARHGRQFKDPLLNQWFLNKNWYLNIPQKYSPDYFDHNNPNPLSKLEQKNVTFIHDYEQAKMANEDIFPNAATVTLSTYDVALSKEVLKRALDQMNRYQNTTTLQENKRIVKEAIDNPDVSY